MTLDVTDVLDDPDFRTDGLVRVRNVETVGENGRAIWQEEQITFSGVVTQMGASARTNRDEDATWISDSIAITTKTELIGSDSTANADIVIYAGKRYTVMTVRNNSNWGAGFYRAECAAIPFR